MVGRFRGDDGGGDGPPGTVRSREEVVARGFLFAGKPNTEQRDAD